MKKNVIVSLADANYFPLLEELINSIKKNKQSENEWHPRSCECIDKAKTKECKILQGQEKIHQTARTSMSSCSPKDKACDGSRK